MKTINIFIVITFLMFAAGARAQQHAGSLKKVTGEVTIQRGSALVEARKRVQLMSGDILITNNESYAGIIFIDGTTITIGPNTEFTIYDYQFEPEVETYSFSMYIKKGTLIYDSGKLGKLSPESVNLSTPRASVGGRGTQFIIEVK